MTEPMSEIPTPEEMAEVTGWRVSWVKAHYSDMSRLVRAARNGYARIMPRKKRPDLIISEEVSK